VSVAGAGVDGQLAKVTRTEGFAVTVGLLRTAQRDIARRSERASRHLLHLFNLPAGSDVTRVLAHIASLEREVRELRKASEGAGPKGGKEVTRAKTSRGARSPAA
jgi:hypothetical protein